MKMLKDYQKKVIDDLLNQSKDVREQYGEDEFVNFSNAIISLRDSFAKENSAFIVEKIATNDTYFIYNIKKLEGDRLRKLWNILPNVQVAGLGLNSFYYNDDNRLILDYNGDMDHPLLVEFHMEDSFLGTIRKINEAVFLIEQGEYEETFDEKDDSLDCRVMIDGEDPELTQDLINKGCEVRVSKGSKASKIEKLFAETSPAELEEDKEAKDWEQMKPVGREVL